jgi:SOS-response transcriptional repressor LexA
VRRLAFPVATSILEVSVSTLPARARPCAPNAHRVLVPDPWSRGCTNVGVSIVEGNCLVPSGIRSGETVVIGYGIAPRDGEIAAVQMSAGAAKRFGLKGDRRSAPMIKHWHWRGGRVLLHASNSEHPSYLLSRRSVHVLGVVLSVHPPFGAGDAWRRLRAEGRQLGRIAPDPEGFAMTMPDDSFADWGVRAGDTLIVEIASTASPDTLVVVRDADGALAVRAMSSASERVVGVVTNYMRAL